MAVNLASINPKQAQAMAQAELERRRRLGILSSGVKAHVEYQRKPLEWITTRLGIPEKTLRWSLNDGYDKHTWDGDVDPIVQMLEALARWENVCVESATGTGKTFVSAAVVLWFMACHENALVVTSAPKADNLLTQVWREIGGMWPKFKSMFPEAELLTGKIRMLPGEGEKEAWTAMAFVAGVGADEDAAQKAAGFHRGHFLIVTEDTPGIDPAIMTAFAHTRTDDHNLQMSLGNPDHLLDSLHRFGFDDHERPRMGVKTLRISALDHPNIVTGTSVIPGAIGARRLVERTEEFGKGTRLYDSRIRGICAKEPEEALIKWEWCVAAAKRWDDPVFREGGRALGVDVADSPTGDRAGVSNWMGACCTEVVAWQVKTDAEEVAERVFAMASDPTNPVEGRYIGMDNVGVGASAYNALARMGIRARKISGGARAVPQVDIDAQWSETRKDDEGVTRAAGPTVVESEAYDSVVSQVKWRMREDLRMGAVALPNDEELFRDLCTATYTTRNGKICVEGRESIMKRLRRSPDKGDACSYGNFVRPRRPRKQVAAPVKTNRNVDTNLERLMSAHAKRAKAEERRIQRQFRRRTP